MSLHTTVLRDEAITALNLREGATAVDATANGGGHSEAIEAAIGTSGTLISIDRDERACQRLKERIPRAHVVCENFRNLDDILARAHVENVDAILADLGWSTDQFENGGRGFSFKYDEPLLMTYGDPTLYRETAADIVNTWGEEDLANLMYELAEERASRKIARAIVEAREKQRIETSGALAKIIETATPRRGRIHPATKTFQALRIAVNDELGALKEFLESAITHLAPGGRLAVITFHSIEDRIVKYALREKKESGIGTLVHKKPIVPTRAEVLTNPRARSAKLRVFEKS